MNGKMHTRILWRGSNRPRWPKSTMFQAPSEPVSRHYKIIFAPDNFPIISTVGCTKQSRAPPIVGSGFCSRNVAACLFSLVPRGNDRPVERSFSSDRGPSQACNNKRGIETGAKHGRLLLPLCSTIALFEIGRAISGARAVGFNRIFQEREAIDLCRKGRQRFINELSGPAFLIVEEAGPVSGIAFLRHGQWLASLRSIRADRFVH